VQWSRRGSGLTTRAAVLALVVCGLMLSLAYPVREFVDQRSRITDLREQEAASRASVEQLQGQLRRWEDPAYVKAQARQRLHYAMPGETQYVVLEPEEAPLPEDGPATPEADPEQQRPWYSQLWDSVENAGTG
jgi:cell division protein FtsB